VLVPYSKIAVVAWPFGFTVPLSVAVESRTLDAPVVVAAGATAVAKVWSEPRLVPASLVATSRKW
jgi:hypothetical protein